MQVIDTWTGWYANALQRALRMSNERFADHLSVSVRQVANWHAQPKIVPTAKVQRILDSALENAPERAKAQFTYLVGEEAVLNESLTAGQVDEVNRILEVTSVTTENALQSLDAIHSDDFSAAAARLAEQYLSTPPAPMLAAASQLQSKLIQLLEQHSCPAKDERELRKALGHTAGVLAYASLDLGRPEIADRHAELAFRMGAESEVPELQAWARGTQSLIARFQKDYHRAYTLINDGMRYANHRNGTAGIRLLAGGAQCRANLGDAPGALQLLAEAEKARAEHKPQDEVHGLFEFSEAKARYYGGSALMWLSDKAALGRAANDSRTAIAMWQDETGDRRSLDDEALAHVYAATAHARLGDLDSAVAAVQPILGLPPERRISWLVKRVDELATHLSRNKYAGSALAAAVVDDLRDWADNPAS